MTRRTSFLAAALVAGLLSVPTFAQPAPNDGGGNRGNNNNNDGGGRNQRQDWQQIREQMQKRFQEQLGASDDEFKVLQPKIEHIQQLSRDAAPRGGFGGMMGGRGGRGQGGPGGQGGQAGGNQPGGQERPMSDVATKSRALADAIDKKETSTEELKAKLNELRAARAKAKDELIKAQEELKSLVSARQEAVLVNIGVLE